MYNKPTNLKLYTKIKSEAKQKFKVWPSAYASGWLVKEYKRRGGKYKKMSIKKSRKRKSRKRRSRVKSRKRISRVKSRKRRSRVKSRKRRSNMRFSKRKSNKKGLSRWFAEEWIDVCKLPKIVPCGRKSAYSSKRTYPYCRPRYKITSSSPKTARSLNKAEIRKRCRKKKLNPSKRVMPK
jgi:hypothetical protein